MWAVSPPAATIRETVTACATGVRNSNLRQRTLGALQQFETNNASYRVAASQDAMASIDSSSYVVSELSDDEMIWLYTNQLARVRRPGRIIYSQLLAAARHGLCSYCQYGQAKNLDHFIPKTIVPALAIDPWNLVPACEQCNKRLLAYAPSVPEEQLLHPYFISDVGSWLDASVNKEYPVTLTFVAQPDCGLPEQIRLRIRNQFRVLGLEELYGVVSARDIVEISRYLKSSFGTGAFEKVRSHLYEVSEAAGLADHTRRSTILNALAKDDWFCSEGYAG